MGLQHSISSWRVDRETHCQFNHFDGFAAGGRNQRSICETDFKLSSFLTKASRSFPGGVLVSAASNLFFSASIRSSKLCGVDRRRRCMAPHTKLLLKPDVSHNPKIGSSQMID